jgi:hypothetical protein
MLIKEKERKTLEAAEKRALEAHLASHPGHGGQGEGGGEHQEKEK